MQQLNQGDVIEFEIVDKWLEFFSGFERVGCGGVVMLLVLRAAEGVVLRVRVLRQCTDERAWVAVPPALFRRQWILPLEQGLAYAVVPRDQVLRRCDKTERELRALANEDWTGDIYAIDE